MGVGWALLSSLRRMEEAKGQEILTALGCPTSPPYSTPETYLMRAHPRAKAPSQALWARL